METIKLSVHEREETGNGPARRLRAQGLIPGISYGKDKTPTSVAVNLEDLRAVWAHGHNVVLELDFAKPAKGAKTAAKGKAKGPRYAVIKEIQFHPIRRHVLHVDLHEIDLAVEIEAVVSIEGVGTPAGLIDGGVIDWERREVTVRALPVDIPSAFELDLSELVIGHHLSVSALKAPKGVTIVDDPETMLVALVPPRVEAAAPEAAAAEEVEPEVVGSQKSEE
jgi:large subunit ribosomal protein L25